MSNRTFLEFFAGIGLVRLALEKNDWRCIYANDNDQKKISVYNMNFRDKLLDERSIEEITSKDIPNATLATASFPCQDLSEAGPREGLEGKRSGVFWEFIRVLDETKNKPKIVMLENVEGFFTSNGGNDLSQAIAALNKLGYYCDILKIDAKYFVPQSRVRIFVFGLEKNTIEKCRLNKINQLLPEHIFRDEKILKFINDNNSLNWFRIDLNAFLKRSSNLIDILDNSNSIPKEEWWGDLKIDKHLKMMTKSNLNKIINAKKKKGLHVLPMYRRTRQGIQRAELREDGLAGCLRTSKGGSSTQFLVIIENDKIKMRKMTISEIRKLMGLPDTFRLPEKYSEAYNDLGDAVVVPLIDWISKNILNLVYDNCIGISILE